ncbi:murein hydrolase activator EnvC family protein [Sporosarcina soli]|jgi:peptidoglycan hydrolase CwlO-like protein|uniref:Murein hydrolase activator EnvC family protein n=1 Tax=Sporosarcina soli TaxID=334736 RepID=A0ABW0TGX0_9BACL
MYKWILSCAIAFLLLISAVAQPIVFASPLKDLQKEKRLNEQKLNELNTSINKKKSEIKTNKSSIERILDKIKTLNGKISETNQNIDQVTAKINQTTKEIKDLRASIEDLEKKIEERDEVLRDRVLAMQVNGGQVNYLDVLLGANSFADFIDRFSAVNTLMDADRKILQQQADDKEQLEKEKALVEKKLAEQQEDKAKLEGLKASLVSQKQEMNKLVDELEAEQEKLVSEQKSLEEEFHDAHEVGKELTNKIAAEQKRAAEAARKAEEERKRKAAAAAASGGVAPVISSGTWTTPASGRYTSAFGWRTHPIYGTKRQHRGADIANSTGTPVYAAGDGVVSHAGPMGTYGNVIMITHSVDGQIYTTVYAHLSSIKVSSGSSVEKGQHIGAIGTTGASTGPHLHFEFHIGNWSASGPSAVNPLRYVPF